MHLVMKHSIAVLVAAAAAGSMLLSAPGNGLGADAPRPAGPNGPALPEARGAAPGTAVGGLEGHPAIDASGTAYVVSHILSDPDTTTLNKEAVASSLMAITPKGQKTTFTLSGISSAPAVTGETLIGTVVLPDFDQYRVVHNLGGRQESTRSVLYKVSLPLSASVLPAAVILEGTFASPPTVMNGLIYVVTSNAVSLLDSSGPLAEILGNFTFDQGAGKSFLYVFDTDLALLSKTPLT